MYVQETFYKISISQKFIGIVIFYKKLLIVHTLSFIIKIILNFYKKLSCTSYTVYIIELFYLCLQTLVLKHMQIEILIQNTLK